MSALIIPESLADSIPGEHAAHDNGQPMTMFGVPVVIDRTLDHGQVVYITKPARPYGTFSAHRDLDWRPATVVRIPNTGELIYSERPHRQSERLRRTEHMRSMMTGAPFWPAPRVAT